MSDKMREEFESWYEGHCAPLEADWFKRDSDSPDDYDYFPAQEAWAGWKASRSALCAGMPEFPEMETIADLDYAHEMPKNGWNEDQFSIWQKLQVAQRNKMQLFAYAKNLKAIINNGFQK